MIYVHTKKWIYLKLSVSVRESLQSTKRCEMNEYLIAFCHTFSNSYIFILCVHHVYCLFKLYYQYYCCVLLRLMWCIASLSLELAWHAFGANVKYIWFPYMPFPINGVPSDQAIQAIQNAPTFSYAHIFSNKHIKPFALDVRAN